MPKELVPAWFTLDYDATISVYITVNRATLSSSLSLIFRPLRSSATRVNGLLSHDILLKPRLQAI